MIVLTLYAFRWVPPFAQGLVRDLRVRWALEEAGLPYSTVLLDFEETKTDCYRALQPFSQVPAIEAEGMPTFESGAIALQIAEQSEALLPSDRQERAQAIAWMFAALNSIEPFLFGLLDADTFHADKAWAREMRPDMEARAITRLTPLDAHLAGRDYLTGRFTVADLMMTTVLRELRSTDLIPRFPAIAAFQARCESRPAFQKALADQLEPFTAGSDAQ